MRANVNIINGRVVSDRVVGFLGQSACYVAALFVMVLGFWKLPRVAQTEKDVFFGVLLVAGVGLLLVVLGTVTHLAVLLKVRDEAAESYRRG